MDSPFASQIHQVVDSLAARQRRTDPAVERDKRSWKLTVHQYREIAGSVIAPTLREAAAALRSKGLDPLVFDRTRRTLAIGLEIEREEGGSARLSFVLHGRERTVEARFQGVSGAERLGLEALSGLGRAWVEEVVISFLRRFYD